MTDWCPFLYCAAPPLWKIFKRTSEFDLPNCFWKKNVWKQNGSSWKSTLFWENQCQEQSMESLSESIQTDWGHSFSNQITFPLQHLLLLKKTRCPDIRKNKTGTLPLVPLLSSRRKVSACPWSTSSSILASSVASNRSYNLFILRSDPLRVLWPCSFL